MNFVVCLLALKRVNTFANTLTLLHTEWPKLYGVLAVLSAIELNKRGLSADQMFHCAIGMLPLDSP